MRTEPVLIYLIYPAYVRCQSERLHEEGWHFCKQIICSQLRRGTTGEWTSSMHKCTMIHSDQGRMKELRTEMHLSQGKVENFKFQGTWTDEKQNLSKKGGNWKVTWIWGIMSLLCEELCAGTRYPERLWSFIHWRYSRTVWTQFCPLHFRMTWLEQGG